MNTNENKKDNEIFDTANIIMAGITGAGKSTLINAVFGEEFAATGKGRPVTQEIKEYRNYDIPVRIWDSVGFEIGNNEEGVSKTKVSITKIKKTIEEQVSKKETDHIHAIWYCINQGGNKYQQTEADFVKELHSIGIPFIIIVTQCVEDDDFAKEIEKINRENGMFDIPVIEVLAKDRKLKGGGCVPAYGLETLVDKTLEMLPSFIKGSFIAGQQIKVVLKREECERIITEYEALAEKGFWDKVPLINMGVVDQRFKQMVKDIFLVYNQMLSENAYNEIIFALSQSWSKGLFSWCVIPSKFTHNQEKLEKLMSEIEEKGSEGLDLKQREFNNSTRTARMITYYGYTLLMSIEDVWEMIREKQIENLEKIVIPMIKDRIQHYLSGKKNKPSHNSIKYKA